MPDEFDVCMNYLEIVGVLLGLLYLWLEYKVSIWLWAVGIIMPAVYIVIYYKAGLYADSGINAYYLLAGVYGWLMWLRHASTAEERKIVHTPVKLIVPMTAAFTALLLIIAWILIRFTDSTVPWLDSFTTALSFIAMWMLAYKYLEQWLVWLVVDVVSCGLYVYKGLDYTAVLYGLYAVIAFFGYLKWKRIMKTDD